MTYRPCVADHRASKRRRQLPTMHVDSARAAAARIWRPAKGDEDAWDAEMEVVPVAIADWITRFSPLLTLGRGSVRDAEPRNAVPRRAWHILRDDRSPRVRLFNPIHRCRA
jgi:hypothetical protein